MNKKTKFVFGWLMLVWGLLLSGVFFGIGLCHPTSYDYVIYQAGCVGVCIVGLLISWPTISRGMKSIDVI